MTPYPFPFLGTVLPLSGVCGDLATASPRAVKRRVHLCRKSGGARAGKYSAITINAFNDPDGNPMTIVIRNVTTNMQTGCCNSCSKKMLGDPSCACVAPARLSATGPAIFGIIPEVANAVNKDGRVYRATYVATSSSGFTCTGTVRVCAGGRLGPKDSTGGIVDNNNRLDPRCVNPERLTCRDNGAVYDALEVCARSWG